MEWNVENLFDTRHDSLKDDQEFLPSSLRHWSYTRYRRKIDNLARIITAVGQWDAPALVALCEVENDSVLRDLTRRSPLKEWKYRYVVTHSPDPRGIDVALLYQRDQFKLLASRSIRIAPFGHHRRTRDVLHVSGLLLTGDTLDVLVCHLPSRAGGVKETEGYRNFVAERIRLQADSLLRARRRPQLIVTGDFNDRPTGSSLRKVLQAMPSPHSPARPDPLKLYQLPSLATREKALGTYKYQGQWEVIDHILVSGNLLDAECPFSVPQRRAYIFHPSFLLQEDSKYGGYEPFRTYRGMKYQGGYSDHLPVYADFGGQGGSTPMDINTRTDGHRK
ncbi:MAG: endonuclease [Mediterranea sp.]|jgi:endonuclease/exonuclease/phosphatase family metal-dependent hydrolase|nr:endonuclease [Mediterranea sp.]